MGPSHWASPIGSTPSGQPTGPAPSGQPHQASPFRPAPSGQPHRASRAPRGLCCPPAHFFPHTRAAGLWRLQGPFQAPGSRGSQGGRARCGRLQLRIPSVTNKGKFWGEQARITTRSRVGESRRGGGSCRPLHTNP